VIDGVAVCLLATGFSTRQGLSLELVTFYFMSGKNSKLKIFIHRKKY
jgi:hypothetical protein